MTTFPQATGRWEISFMYRGRPQVRYATVANDQELREAMNQVRADFRLLDMDKVTARKMEN